MFLERIKGFPTIYGQDPSKPYEIPTEHVTCSPLDTTNHQVARTDQRWMSPT